MEAKYLKLQDDMMNVKQKLEQLERFEVPNLKSEKQKLEDQVNDVNVDNERMKKALEEHQLEHKQRSGEMSKSLNDSRCQLNEQRSKHDEICRSLDDSRSKNEQLTQRLSSSQSQIQQQKKTMADTTSNQRLNDEKQQKRVDALQEKINGLTYEKVQQDQKIKEIQGKNDQARNDNEDLEKEKQQLSRELQELKEKLNGLKSEKDANDRVIADQKQLLEQSISKSSGADADLNKFKTKIMELSDKLK